MNEINNNKQAVNNNNQHKKHKRNYDKDFIQQVIGVYKSGAYETIIDCANAYGICSKTLGYCGVFPKNRTHGSSHPAF